MIASGNEVRACAFRFIVGRVEVYERSAGDSNLRGAVFEVSVKAVNQNTVSVLYSVGIQLLNIKETAFDSEFTVVNVYSSYVTDEVTAFNRKFAAVSNIRSEERRVGKECRL